MSRRSRIAALTVIAALAAAPAGALGQDGAGDDQYTDPFGETTPQGQTETTITPTPAPRKPAAASPTSVPKSSKTPAKSAQGAADAAPRLAETGFDTRLLLLAGVALMAAGAALRLGLRPR